MLKSDGAFDAAGKAEAWAAGYWVGRVEALLVDFADAGERSDLRMFFEERAAICEFDGGVSRFAAERAAFGLLAAKVAARPAEMPD